MYDEKTNNINTSIYKAGKIAGKMELSDEIHKKLYYVPSTIRNVPEVEIILSLINGVIGREVDNDVKV